VKLVNINRRSIHHSSAGCPFENCKSFESRFYKTLKTIFEANMTISLTA